MPLLIHCFYTRHVLCSLGVCIDIHPSLRLLIQLKRYIMSLKKVKESEVAQSCPTLCDPMDCSLPGLLHWWDFSGKNTGVGCHFLLQEIFLTQGLNPGLPQCRQTLYHLSHQGWVQKGNPISESKMITVKLHKMSCKGNDM